MHAYGGVFVREQAKAVRSAGHEVVVLHLAGGPMPEPCTGLWTVERELDGSLTEGIDAYHAYHRRLGMRGASYPLYLLSGIAAYRRLRANGFRPDIIHAHVYAAGVPAAIIATRSGIPFVMTEHSSGVAQRSLDHLEARKAHYAYTRAARVLPVSRFLRESIRTYAVDADAVIVPNAVDTSIFFPPHSPPAEGGSLRRLLFVGNLEPMQLKGFPTLLQALVLLRQRRGDWELHVIGDGAERPRYEASATDLGLGNCVTFHGSCPKTVVADMMRGSDLLVQPSRVETFGAVVVEALVSGLPVVSTTVGDIPELVDERSGRLVAPDDPNALADALDDALDNLESFDGRAIADTASERFRLEVVGDQLDRIYQVVLAEAAAGAPAPRAAL